MSSSALGVSASALPLSVGDAAAKEAKDFSTYCIAAKRVVGRVRDVATATTPAQHGAAMAAFKSLTDPALRNGAKGLLVWHSIVFPGDRVALDTTSRAALFAMLSLPDAAIKVRFETCGTGRGHISRPLPASTRFSPLSLLLAGRRS